MDVRSLIPVSSVGAVRPDAPASAGAVQSGPTGSFAGYLKEVLALVNAEQVAVDEAAARLALGEGGDLHELVLAAEKANLSLELAIQIRNKALEAYQEIMRMPV